MKAAAPVCPPAVLAGIADLELVARIVVEGLVSGLHRSPFHGYTAEFSQYRHYQPGDDLKYVDWKLAARTDRIYTKQFRETTNMAATLVVDASASMEFPPAPEISKHRYAVIMAAALAHLISRQGDAIGLLAGGDAGVFLPARTGRSHLTRLLASIASLKTGGTWSAAASIRRAAERLTRRGLILVLSDLYDDEDLARAELRRAVRHGHEVVVFQVVSRSEIEFSYRRSLEVVDLESGRTVAVDAAVARREYKDALAAFLERWRTLAGRGGIRYSLVVTDTPPERALRSFLLSRRATH